MTFDRLRRKMKVIIWMVTILFVGSIFFIAGGSMCVKGRNDEEVARQERERERQREEAAKPKPGKDDLDTTSKAVLARIELHGRQAIVTEGELNEQINQFVKYSPYLKGMAPKSVRPLIGRARLDEMVNQRLVELATESQKVDLSAVERQIEDELNQPETARALRQYGLSRDQYRAERLRSDRLRKVMELVTSGASVPESRVREYYEMKKDEFKDPQTKQPKTLDQVRREIERILRSEVGEPAIKDYYEQHKDRWRLPARAVVRHLMVDPASEARSRALTATDAELKAHYEQNKSLYMGDARVELRHIFVDPAAEAYAKKVVVSDADLAKFYETKKAEFEKPARSMVSRILIAASRDASAADRSKAEQKLKDLLAQVKKSSFESVARSSSDDKVSGPKGGDLGWVETGQMSPAFDRAVGATKAGELSEIFSDDEGFQVVKVVRKEDKRVPPLAEVASDVKKLLAKEKAQALAEEEIKALQREVKARPQDFETVARDRSQAPSKSKGGHLGELALGENKGKPAVEEVGSFGYMDQDVQNSLGSLKAGDVSDVVRSARGFHVFKVDKKLDPEPKPLADVKSEVADAVRRRKMEDEAFRASREITEKLIEGESFEKLVERYSDGKDRTAKGLWDGVVLSSEEKQTVEQGLLADVAVEGQKLPESIVGPIKELKVGQISAPVNHEKKSHFFHLVSLYPPRYRPLDDELRKEIRFALNPSVSLDEIQAFYREHKAEFTSRPRTSADFVLIHDEDQAAETSAKIAANKAEFDATPGKQHVDGEVRNAEIRKVLASLKPGEITPKPIKTNAGWLIARLNASEEAKEPTFESVEKQVREKVLAQRKEQLYESWLGELKNQARITRTADASSL